MPSTRILSSDLSDEMTPAGAKRPVAPVEEPKKEELGEERYVTVKEVQALIDSLTNAIKTGFVLKTDFNSVTGGLQRHNAILQSNIPSENTITDLAKRTVPICLRGLDSSGSGRTGNVLMLQPGSGGEQDTAYFGTVKPAAGIDFSKVALGYTKSGTTITILTGEIDRITVAQTDVVVADDNYIYVRRTIADDTMLVTVGASVPSDDTVFKYYRLYQFSVTGTNATLKFALRPFDIEVSDEDLTEKMAFAIIGITGTSVELQSGKVCKGTDAAVDVASQSITVADGQTIYVVYTFATGTATLGVSNTFPIGASGTYVKALHLMDVTAGVASLNFTYHKGVVQIDGCYS